jgi:hypothetical protein
VEDADRVDRAGVDARQLYEQCFSEQTARRLLEAAYQTALAGEP